jgi:hypothetical protein
MRLLLCLIVMAILFVGIDVFVWGKDPSESTIRAIYYFVGVIAGMIISAT